MKGEPEERALRVGEYIAERGATVRSTAQVFGVSKSTVHKDVTGRLRHLDPALYRRVQKILAHNKAERHLRGGRATQQKYAQMARPQSKKY